MFSILWRSVFFCESRAARWAILVDPSSGTVSHIYFLHGGPCVILVGLWPVQHTPLVGLNRALYHTSWSLARSPVDCIILSLAPRHVTHAMVIGRFSLPQRCTYMHVCTIAALTLFECPGCKREQCRQALLLPLGVSPDLWLKRPKTPFSPTLSESPVPTPALALCRTFGPASCLTRVRGFPPEP